MAHIIEHDDKKKITYLVYLSEINLDQRIGIVTELCNMLRDNGSQKILIDARRLQCSMTPVEQGIWGNFVGGLEELKNAWVAVVYAEDAEINSLSIQQAAKAGHKVIKFTDIQDAENWLMSQSIEQLNVDSAE